jgi:hypothetical protein
MNLNQVTETEWQQQVIQLAHLLGWKHNYTRRSIGKGHQWVTATSTVGWPDLTMWHEDQHRVIFAELKTEKGKLAPEQGVVLRSLAAAGAEVYVWRPSDLDHVQETLSP